MKIGFVHSLLAFTAKLCVAQNMSQHIIYELAESILSEHRREVTYKADTSVVLLSQAFSTPQADKFIQHYLLGNPEEKSLLLKYLSPDDLAYIRQQLPVSKAFAFEQEGFGSSWIKVLPKDTLIAIRKRLDYYEKYVLPKGYVLPNKEYVVLDSIERRYGSSRICTISYLLFSKKHNYAIVNTCLPSGRETWSIYKKKGRVWREEEVLYVLIHD